MESEKMQSVRQPVNASEPSVTIIVPNYNHVREWVFWPEPIRMTDSR